MHRISARAAAASLARRRRVGTARTTASASADSQHRQHVLRGHKAGRGTQRCQSQPRARAATTRATHRTTKGTHVAAAAQSSSGANPEQGHCRAMPPTNRAQGCSAHPAPRRRRAGGATCPPCAAPCSQEQAAARRRPKDAKHQPVPRHRRRALGYAQPEPPCPGGSRSAAPEGPGG